MDINGTLLVQAVNFFIAYYVLKCFFLKPALEVMNAEDQQKKSLALAIESRKALVIVKEQEKQSRWREQQRLFKNLIPYNVLDSIKINAPERSTVQMHDDLSALKRDVITTLIEKVEHVRW